MTETPQPMAGPSSPPPALRNVLRVFAAHFHVRKGNQLLLVHPSPSDSSTPAPSDLEWKAIPNGSHAVSRDWLLFEVAPGPAAQDRVGLAVFRKRDLDRQARQGQEQRGARLVAAGAIVACPSRTSASWRACTLPHLAALAGLADQLALDDPVAETASERSAAALKAYYDSARFDPSCQTTGRYSLPPAPGFKHLPVSDYDADPLWQLPIIADALGPLLPTLLKRCLIPGYRLLLFSPTGGETEHAAAIALNLGEIAQAASCVGANVEEQRGRDAHPSSEAARSALSGGVKPSMWIRGLVGLQDMGALEEEARGESTTTAKGWIAWTTDKLFLEKANLYDAVLDLTPLVQQQQQARQQDFSSDAEPQRRINADLPHLLSPSRDAKGKLRLVRQQANAREFATFRDLDQQAFLDAHRTRRRKARARREDAGAVMTRPPTSGPSRNASYSSSASRSNSSVIRTALTLLRYWLASWWILPSRWRLNLQRSSFGYVPLSIRSDGGVRGSLMLLDDMSSSSDGEEGEEATAASHEAGSSAISVRSEVAQGEEEEDDDEDVDPILLATGAIGHSSLRRRRTSRASEVDGGGDAGGLVVGGTMATATATATATGSSRRPRSDRIGEATSEGASSAQVAGSHARLADALFASWSEWLTDVIDDVEEVLYRFCPAFADGEEGSGERSPLNVVEDEGGATLTLKGKDLARAGLSASSDVDVALVRAMAGAYTARTVVVDKGWALARWFC